MDSTIQIVPNKNKALDIFQSSQLLKFSQKKTAVDREREGERLERERVFHHTHSKLDIIKNNAHYNCKSWIFRNYQKQLHKAMQLQEKKTAKSHNTGFSSSKVNNSLRG